MPLIKNILIGIASLSTILTLTACSQGNILAGNISLEDTISLKAFPDWNEKSVSELEKMGWNVEKSDTVTTSNGNEIIFPQTFYATDSSGKCAIQYNSVISEPFNIKAGDDFNTQDYIYKTIQRNTSQATVNNELSKAYIKIDGNSSAIEAYKVQYSYPNYVFNVEDTLEGSVPSTTAPERTEQGTINEFMMARFFSTELDNPAAKLAENKNAPINKKGVPVIDITYKCLDADLDNKVIEILENESFVTLKY